MEANNCSTAGAIEEKSGCATHEGHAGHDNDEGSEEGLSQGPNVAKTSTDNAKLGA